MPDRELRCLLIGFAGGRLLLPGSMVVEVLPYATPLRVAEVPRWVLGSLLWRACTVPLLAIEPLVTGQPAAPGPRSRIVVLTTPSERVQHLALVSLEVPQLSLLKREMLKASDEVDCPPGMLRAVRIGGDQDAFIPDFDLLCEELAPLGIYRA